MSGLHMARSGATRRGLMMRGAMDNLDSDVLPTPIHIAAAIMSDAAGRLLLVRKRGTQVFMQPGGKIEPGEEAGDALRRELAEELGLVVTANRLVYLGCRTAPAANEPDCSVEAELFVVASDTAVAPLPEIEEIAWLDPDMPSALALAPLTRDHVLALHRERRNHG